MSIILALINVNFTFGIGLNIIADLWFSLVIANHVSWIATNEWPGDNCQHYEWPPGGGEPERVPGTAGCYRALFALKILVGITVGFGAIVA